MKRLLLVLILLLSILLSNEGVAQGFNTTDGYVITYADDTIHGTFRNRNQLYEQIWFKPAGSESYQEYPPEEIRAFRLADGRYYQARAITDQAGQKMFLLTLAEGILSVHQSANTLYAEKDKTLYKLEQVDTPQGGGLVQEDKRYLRILNYLTADCPSIKNSVERTSLLPQSLAKLAQRYNECQSPIEEGQVEDSRPTGVKRFRVGIKAGTALSQAVYKPFIFSSTSYDLSAELSYVAGVIAAFRFNDKFSLHPELLLIGRSGDYRREGNRTSGRRYYVSTTSLQFPLSLRYTLPTNRLRPFVFGGGSFSYIATNSSYRVELGERTIIPLQRGQLGYRFGGGIAYQTAQGKNWNVEYAYDRAIASGINSAIQIYMISHQLSLAYIF